MTTTLQLRTGSALVVFIAVAGIFVGPAAAQNPFRNIFPFGSRSNDSGERSRRDTPSSSQGPTRSRSTRSAPAARPSSSGTSSRSGAATRSQSSKVITKPTVITSPGYYVLGSNVTGASEATTGAIVIAAPGVTLDLAGFQVTGRPSDDPDNCGVAITADRAHVRNGSIEQFPGEMQCGVLVEGGISDFTLENLRIGECETGILLNPENEMSNPVRVGRIERCSVTSGSIGILAFPSAGVTIDSCSVSNCSPKRDAEGEGSGAVLRGGGFLVRDCSFTSSTDGLRLEADSSSVRGVICAGNRERGCVVAGRGVDLREGVFSGNGGEGLLIESGGGRVTGCLISGNGRAGVESLTGGNLLDDCVAYGNTSASFQLQPSDHYRNCAYSPEPQGGIARGENLLMDGQ